MMSWQPTTLCATSGQNCGGGGWGGGGAGQGHKHAREAVGRRQKEDAFSGSLADAPALGVLCPRCAHLAAALVLPLVDVQRLVPAHCDLEEQFLLRSAAPPVHGRAAVAPHPGSHYPRAHPTAPLPPQAHLHTAHSPTK